MHCLHLNDSVFMIATIHHCEQTNSIHIGVGFHVNNGTDAATIKNWDINIKWRKLLSV